MLGFLLGVTWAGRGVGVSVRCALGRKEGYYVGVSVRCDSPCTDASLWRSITRTCVWW